jgi:hypothetical protein
LIELSPLGPVEPTNVGDLVESKIFRLNCGAANAGTEPIIANAAAAIIACPTERRILSPFRRSAAKSLCPQRNRRATAANRCFVGKAISDTRRRLKMLIRFEAGACLNSFQDATYRATKG